MVKRSSAPNPPQTSVGTVLDQLGPLVVRHDSTDERGERPVLGVVIDDRELGPPLAPGTAVLGVGAATDDAIDELLARAGRAGASVVLVKHQPGRAGRQNPGPGPALVEVAADLTWEQLHVFVRTALLPVGGRRTGGPHTLFEVANAIALLADGAVVIEDEHLRVIAYSSLDHELDEARRATILGRQIPEPYVAEMRAGGIIRHLEGSSDPVRFDLAGPGLLPRLVVALRAEGRVVGLLWVITDDEREANARRVLADSAPEVAVEVQRLLTADSSRASDREAAAREMLEGRSVRAAADLLGGQVEGGLAAILLRPVATAPGEIEALARTAQLATVYLDAYRFPALVAPVVGAQVELVVGLTGSTTAERARALVDELVIRTRATFGIEVRGALGTVVPDVRDLPSSRRDALAVLDLLLHSERGVSASFDEVRVEVALRELVHHARVNDHLARGPIVDLVASPARGDRLLVETVRAYLDSSGDVTRTAGDIGVHRNTVRYRVQRFAEITGTDLTDPGQRLLAEVQLRATAPG